MHTAWNAKNAAARLHRTCRATQLHGNSCVCHLLIGVGHNRTKCFMYGGWVGVYVIAYMYVFLYVCVYVTVLSLVYTLCRRVCMREYNCLTVLCHGLTKASIPRVCLCIQPPPPPPHTHTSTLYTSALACTGSDKPTSVPNACPGVPFTCMA